jgi:hypothetical protein
MAAGAGDLGTLDLSLGGDGGASAGPPAADAAAPAEPPAAAAPEPAWLTDPLAPPFPELAGTR